jgi:ssDNA-binding Zn-finger/Zn-ribbon topoisomerase 1
MDVTGYIGNPETENKPCDDFIDAERVKIQDKANWLEKVKTYGAGDVYICYNCTNCNQREYVKIYKRSDWENYYSQHYRDGIELPNFCKECGSVMGGIVKDPGD